MSQSLKNEHNEPDTHDQQDRPAPISFAEFAANPGRVFDAAARSERGVTIERAGETFRVRRVHRRRAQAEHRPITADDPLWDIIGIGHSGQPGNDVASNKYKYLADAYADLHEPREADTPTTEGTPNVPESDKA